MKRIIISTLFVCCTSLFAGCDKMVISNPAYAIGTITNYSRSGEDPYIVYNYMVDGVQYGNEYPSAEFGGKWVVPDDNYKKGDMYMVQYDAGCVNSGKCKEPQESRMLFNYPVHDSADYNNYVAQFAVTPPTP